ncbi:MAG: DUF1844 domain-containing protein [Bryobacteraceae bacterium]
MSDTEFPLPPASFEFLTASLKMQAEVQLGLLHFGEEKDRPTPNFPLARHSIDMLAMLVEKTKGNLSTEEQRQIENSVTELRFRYIQALEHRSTQAATTTPAESAEAEEASHTEEQAAS